MTTYGFTGTRAGTTVPQHAALREVLAPLCRGSQDTLGHGCCEGADRQAHAIWHELGGLCEYHPGDLYQFRWARHASDSHSVPEVVHQTKPYLARNRDIVKASLIMVACPGEMEEQLRSGTWATIRYARELRRPLVLVMPDGSVKQEPAA